MELITEREAFPDAKALIAAVKQWDCATFRRWGFWRGTVAGRTVALKTYGRSYPQIFDVDGVRHGGAMDMKPRAFASLIERALS